MSALGRDREPPLLAGTGTRPGPRISRCGPETTPAGSLRTPSGALGTSRRSGAWISPVARTGSRCEALLASGEAHLGGGDRSAAAGRFRCRGALLVRKGPPDALRPGRVEPQLRTRRVRGRHVRPRADRSPGGSARRPAGRGSGAGVCCRGASSIALDDDGPRATRRVARTRSRSPGPQPTTARPVYALSALCDVQAGPDHAPDRLRYTSEMLEPRRSLRDFELELLARRFLLVAQPRGGRPRRGRRPGARVPARAAELRHPLYKWYVPLWKATRAARRAVLRVDAANLEAATIGERAGSSNAVLLCDTQRWCLLVETGDRVGIEALLPTSRTRRSMRCGSRSCGRSCRRSSATSRTRAGDWTRSRRGLRRSPRLRVAAP